MTTVRFTKEDLARFSAASCDRNPLHISEEYARTTPYAEPVVFGLLSLLAGLGQLSERHDRQLRHISAEFRNPLSVDAPYRFDIIESATDNARVKLYDTTRLMMTATFAFAQGQGHTESQRFPKACCATEPEDRNKDALIPGTRVTGTYAPETEAFAQVVERWGLDGKGATPHQIAAMMWASYVVGMHLPGKRAVFWRLKLEFHDAEAPQEEPFSYDAAVEDVDERYDLLRSTGTLSAGSQPYATAHLSAFVRQDSPQPSLRRISDLLPESEHLKGMRALVIGGSRGLGAAIAQALASQGCSVLLNYQQSTAEAERIRASLGDRSTQLELVQGNAADVAWCLSLRDMILKRYGGLDLLVCNASPPIRPLAFEPDKLPQFQDFVARSLSLVSAPMSTFLGMLADQAGWNIVLSSSFVKELPAIFAHYVTAKCALEGLVNWAAAQYPTVRHRIVRPPKLLTDQTNTTMGRQGAIEVEQVAAAIVRQICQSHQSQALQIMETF
ncbi:MAG: SDR family NAD(P)-dependent oxidoreductase [Nitrospira sp.]|nr:SDR family NAD(P)-dependent oxidoreductase [Nitrospira sp.]